MDRGGVRIPSATVEKDGRYAAVANLVAARLATRIQFHTKPAGKYPCAPQSIGLRAWLDFKSAATGHHRPKVGKFGQAHAAMCGLTAEADGVPARITPAAFSVSRTARAWSVAGEGKGGHLPAQGRSHPAASARDASPFMPSATAIPIAVFNQGQARAGANPLAKRVFHKASSILRPPCCLARCRRTTLPSTAPPSNRRKVRIATDHA